MSEPVVEKRTCISCNQEMPVRDGREAIFRKLKGGYAKVCKYCQLERKKVVDRGVERNQTRIDSLHLEVLAQRAREYGEKLKEERLKLGGVPNIAEMMEVVLYNFGGIEMMGLQNAALFLSAAPNSAIRQRVLASMSTMGTKVSQFGFAKKPVHMMNDEELEEAIKESRERLLTPRVFNAEEERAAG